MCDVTVAGTYRTLVPECFHNLLTSIKLPNLLVNHVVLIKRVRTGHFLDGKYMDALTGRDGTERFWRSSQAVKRQQNKAF